jgi:hypothetical protein
MKIIPLLSSKRTLLFLGGLTLLAMVVLVTLPPKNVLLS